MVLSIPLKSPGDPIFAEEWNAIVNRLQGSFSTQEGSFDGIWREVNTDRGWQEPYDTYIWTGIAELPPYSLVQVAQQFTSEPYTDPVQQATEEYDDGSVFITNGEVTVAAGDAFSGRVVDHYPVLVRYNASDQPEVGLPCGPISTSSGLVVLSGDGLLCLSEPDPTLSYIWAVAIGGGGGGAVQMGKLGGNVPSTTTTSVPLVNENLGVIPGEVVENVKNVTAITLLMDSYVYVYRMKGWPADNGTATHSMFPSQLDLCPTVITVSPSP